ncbi:hypothetical protein, partial [uncultured Vibrio sp.]|uniref:hypothetical protein n=1 Tax=uncultured Vibrio sp. TaxID=114054 RepID=UPI002604BA87
QFDFNTVQPPTIRIEYNYDSDGSENKNAKIYDKFLKNDYSGDYFLNDWGTAGYKMGSELPQESELSGLETFHVSSYGAKPNQDSVDDYLAIQSAIDAAVEAGGGIVQFESGTYDINIDKNEWNTLSITASNIILRGRGDKGDSATIIRQHETTLDVQAVATKHLINVGEGTNTGINSFSSSLVKDVIPGDDKVQIDLNTRVALEPGDTVILTSYMKGINGEFSREPLLEALKPLTLDETWTIRNGSRAVRFANTITEVKEIDSDLGSNIVEVTVATPFPYEFKISSGSDLRLYTQRFENVGIENLQIEMMVPDWYSYGHHKVTSTYNYDYGNGGIRFHQVKNSWVQGVTIHNFLMDLSISNSLYNTVDNVTISGVAGHHGIGYYGTQGAGSYHNVVQNIEMSANRTHAISYNQSSGGNVLRKLSTKVRNDTHSNAFIANIDFHGGVLGHNLVEQSGQIQINSAGAWT